jgi:hypothetical protein
MLLEKLILIGQEIEALQSVASFYYLSSSQPIDIVDVKSSLNKMRRSKKTENGVIVEYDKTDEEVFKMLSDAINGTTSSVKSYLVIELMNNYNQYIFNKAQKLEKLSDRERLDFYKAYTKYFNFLSLR